MNGLKPLVLAISLLISNIAHSQQKQLEINEVYYNKTANYNFNAEWQYLSTDLYLMNMGTVNTLLADVWGSERQWKKNVQSIFITAQIQGSVLDGLTYPLYNFIAENGSLEVQDAYDGIHLIDNMPLADKDNLISSKISMEVVTKAKPTIIMEFIGKQMDLISRFSSFPKAVSSLTSELTRLGSCGTKKYIFNSTIQIYKDFNPDRQIHSIGVYVFHPSGQHLDFEHDDAFNRFMASASNNVNKNTLFDLMKWQKYPYLIVVNYKSRYSSSLDTKTEINERTIISREDETNRKYANKELFPELYEQENQLNEFLKSYVELQNSNIKYNYNQQPSILLEIASKYQTFCDLKDSRLQKFGKDDVFKHCFWKHYDDIAAKAELTLTKNEQLKKAVEVIKILKEYNNFTNTSTNEETLSLLNYFPVSESPLSHKINELKSKIEDSQYQQLFAQAIINLETYNREDDYQELKQKAAATNCQYCITKAQTALKNYESHIEDERNAEIDRQLADLKDTAHIVIRETSSCIFQIENCGFQINDEYFNNNLQKLRQKSTELENTANTTGNDKEQTINILETLISEIRTIEHNLKYDLEILKQQNQMQRENALSRFDNSVSIWQNCAQKIKLKINKILTLTEDDKLHFTIEQERTFKNIAQEFNRLNALSKTTTAVLTIDELDSKADDLKRSSSQLVTKTDNFYNELINY